MDESSRDRDEDGAFMTGGGGIMGGRLRGGAGGGDGEGMCGRDGSGWGRRDPNDAIDGVDVALLDSMCVRGDDVEIEKDGTGGEEEGS